MNIAIVGHGKMGKEVEVQAKRRKHAVAFVANEYDQVAQIDDSMVDCAIEFTEPGEAVRNITLLAENGVSVVVGTTGWYDQLPQIESIVQKTGIGLLYSPNLSIGVNLFWKIITHAAGIMNSFDAYDVFGHEYHHAQKADAPSGTALKTADVILKNFPRKTSLATGTLTGKPNPDELQFTATRGGSVPGTHSVFFDSEADTIEITHTARNRSGFALGAVIAAEWLRGKKGLFTMDDVLADLLKRRRS